MATNGNGQLVPVGGGDAIPLLHDNLTLGRRESCDICLRFPNVSGLHCALTFKNGYWHIEDLNSTNGIKVNGDRVHKKALAPNDTITIAKRTYRIDYTPVGQQSLNEMLDSMEDAEDDAFSESLLEKAGLARPSEPLKPGSRRLVEMDDDEDDDDD